MIHDIWDVRGMGGLDNCLVFIWEGVDSGNISSGPHIPG